MATDKQKLAALKISENLRKEKPQPKGKILKEVGYSKSVSESPSIVTKSKGFQELLEQAGVTDEKLAQVLNDGLDATVPVVMGTKSEESFVDIQPDYKTRHKYLETGLKVRGLRQTDTGGNTIIFNKGDIVKDKYVKD